jgi:hypothetical protein
MVELYLHSPVMFSWYSALLVKHKDKFNLFYLLSSCLSTTFQDNSMHTLRNHGYEMCLKDW